MQTVWIRNFKLFSMNDPGEKADEGALMIAKYGKGYFTYTGLVFFESCLQVYRVLIGCWPILLR